MNSNQHLHRIATREAYSSLCLPVEMARIDWSTAAKVEIGVPKEPPAPEPPRTVV